MQVVDDTGSVLNLGKKLGQGGEGAVFEVPSQNGLVAKVYHSPLTTERAEKIRLMGQMRDDRLAKLTAWPVRLLRQSNGAPIGLLMPRIVGRTDIHNLYSPKSRLSQFTQADWRFLVFAGANTARAFAVVHDAGCVIGDVNHGSILVAQDATVRLIDCDSFQVISGQRRFLCEVGVETFTPPELQGKPFKGIVRTANHDAFGLAVMLFLLLFMGRHPFAGRYLGRGDMPIPKAIEETRFAYGHNNQSFQMEQPPGTPSLSIVGVELANLFERAFSQASKIGGRPTPRDWINALDRLRESLRKCAAHPSHWHREGSACPWCAMEAKTGVQLFPIVLTTDATAGLNVEALWRSIEAVTSPGPQPAIPSHTFNASTDALNLAGWRKKQITISLLTGFPFCLLGLIGLFPFPFPGVLVALGVVIFFAGYALLSRAGEVRQFKKAFDEAQANWSQVEEEWKKVAGSSLFGTRKAQLQIMRDDLSKLPRLRADKLNELTKNQRDIQFRHFLDSFEIDKAKITGIGPARKQTLESYGIETAADIFPGATMHVPGFGPTREKALLNWRASVEKQFRFDPKKALDPRDTAKIEQEIAGKRYYLEQALRSGAGELQQIADRVKISRQQLFAPLQSANFNLQQCTADYEAARK